MLHLLAAHQRSNLLIDNAEDLDIVLPVYNLIECRKNYLKTSGTSWNYYKDISTDPTRNLSLLRWK